MIKIKQGNILTATEDIICHQVNCMGVMGSGLAKQIKERFQKAYTEYEAFCKANANKEILLGQAQIVRVQNKFICNIFGQLEYGRGRRQTEYKALERAFNKLAVYINDKGNELYNKSIAIPYGIGCGLGGGNWSTVYEIIEKQLKDCNVMIYKLL